MNNLFIAKWAVISINIFWDALMMFLAIAWNDKVQFVFYFILLITVSFFLFHLLELDKKSDLELKDLREANDMFAIKFGVRT